MEFSLFIVILQSSFACHTERSEGSGADRLQILRSRRSLGMTGVRIIFENDINPPDLGAALATGRVDGILTWSPITFTVRKNLGDQVIVWPAQEGQDIYWILVTRAEILKNRPKAMEKLLRTLGQAATFYRENPNEAGAIIFQRLNHPGGEWDKNLRFEIFLDQNLLLVMEDEADWLIRNRLSSLNKIPNFMDYFDYLPLLKVFPGAVRLGVPGEMERIDDDQK